MVMEPFCNQSSLTIETFHVNMFFTDLASKDSVSESPERVKAPQWEGTDWGEGLAWDSSYFAASMEFHAIRNKRKFPYLETSEQSYHVNIYRLFFLLTPGLWDWVTDAVSGEATSAHPPGASKARLCSYNFSPLW